MKGGIKVSISKDRRRFRLRGSRGWLYWLKLYRANWALNDLGHINVTNFRTKTEWWYPERWS
jgi:hypothetical protein